MFKFILSTKLTRPTHDDYTAHTTCSYKTVNY